MLKKFAVENYRGFKDRVEMDLSKIRNYEFHTDLIQNGLVSKCMVVGRNGCGKTNFGLALFDIVGVLTDFQLEIKQKYPFGYLNGDSDLDQATFAYEFQFGSRCVEYEYRKTTPDSIVYESLKVDGIAAFVRDGGDADYSGLGSYGAGQLRIDIQDGPLSVLRFIANNTNQPEDSAIAQVMNFVRGMLYVRAVQGGNVYVGFTKGREILTDYIIRNGYVDEFKKVLEDMADLKVDLDVVRGEGIPSTLAIKTKRKLLNFDLVASSGTSVLMLHYYWMKHLGDVTLLYLDEFDAYYHFELAEKVLRYFVGKTDIQCIFTSHNTSLVSNRILRPDCYMCLDSRGITALPDLTNREIREGHSLEKLLRGGEFDERAQDTVRSRRVPWRTPLPPQDVSSPVRGQHREHRLVRNGDSRSLGTDVPRGGGGSGARSDLGPARDCEGSEPERYAGEGVFGRLSGVRYGSSPSEIRQSPLGQGHGFLR